MNRSQIDFIEALDRQTEELVQELAELELIVKKAGMIEDQLRSLRQTRSLFVQAAPESEKIVTSVTITDHDQMGSNNRAVLDGLRHGSIADVACGLLREAGRPLHVTEVMRQLKSRGIQTSKPTLVSALSRLTQAGKLDRTRESTYVLVNGKER